MNKFYKGMLGGVSALALGIGASSVMAADLDDRIEEAHSDRVTALTMGIHWFNLDIEGAPDGGGESSSFHHGYLGGVGRLDIPMHDVYSLQVDAHGDVNLNPPDARSEAYAVGSMIGVHLNYREPETYLLGAFVGFGTANMADGDSSASENAFFHFGGVEAQYHMEDWTFYAQGGGGSVRDGDSQTDWAGDNGFARGVVRYYFNDGLGKLQGDILYLHGAGNTNGFSTVMYGVEAEHHIADYSNGFISAFARFEHQDVDENSGDDEFTSVQAQTIMGGIRVNLGYADPKTRDRMGPGVDFADMQRVHANVRSVD